MAQKPTAARNALKWLRRASTKRYIEPEISKIENSVDAAAKRQRVGPTTLLKDLFALRVLKPIGISTALMFFAQLSGMNGVSLYTVQIFRDTGAVDNPNMASIVFGATQIITVLIVPFVLVEKWGRRSLLILSELTMFFGLAALGTFFYFKEHNNNVAPEGFEWVPLPLLILITIGYNVGLGPLPWVLTAEILPNHIKELASSCISIAYWSFSFAAGKSFPDIEDAIGSMGVYWVSAGVCLAGCIFVFFFVPETKGKSSEEIQKLFMNQNDVMRLDDSAKSPTDVSVEEGLDNPVFVNQDDSNIVVETKVVVN